MTSTIEAVDQADRTEGHRPTTLEVEHLTVTFRPHKPRRASAGFAAVRDVSFSVDAGRTLVLLGESGSGKSVTARALLGLYGAEATIGGQARLDGRSLVGLGESEMSSIRGARIGMVPQDPSGSLDPLRRVGRQIVEVLRCHGIETSRRSAARRSEALLADVGIADPARVARSFPHELSGGMRQRIVIAMAVACEPRMLIADEPTTALDVTVQAQVLELFAALQQEHGMALLLVTHDVDVARQVADDVAVMYAGRIVEEGPASEVLDASRHPYTAALLAAVPTPEVPRGQLRAIPGRPPNPGEALDHGCAFAPRCSFATDPCRSAVPERVIVGPRHRSACLLATSGASLSPTDHEPSSEETSPEVPSATTEVEP